MRGVYTVTTSVTAVTTAEPLLYIATPADTMIEILSASITCEDEDTSEQIKARLTRVASGSVAGGVALTPKPTEEQSAASGCTAKGGDTAITGLTSDGAADAIHAAGANKLGGWHYDPTPEERAIVTISDEVVLETVDTIANSCDLLATITYREIG